MNFLAPLYALAALAIVAPIAFHLVRRRPKNKVEFSSLLFLEPTPPKLTRSSQIDHWLLLLLRSIAILLVAAAFARPYWDVRESAEVTTSSVRRLLLIDTSASMRREGFMESAMSQAKDWIQRSENADVVGVYAFHQHALPLVSMLESTDTRPDQRKAIALNSLDHLQPTWQASDLGQALQEAIDATQADQDLQTDTAPLRTEIVVLSDFQEGMSIDRLASISWPNGCRVRTVIVKGTEDQKSNAQASLLANDPQQEELESGNANKTGVAKSLPQSPMRIRVSNSPDSNRESFQLSWLDFKNQPIAAPLPLSATVPKGQSQTLRANAIPDDAYGLRLTGDSVAFDNEFYFAPRRKIKKTILCIDAPNSEAKQTLSFFLKQLPFSNDRFDVELQVVAPGNLANQNLSDLTVYAIASSAATPADLQALHSYVKKGGSLLWVWDQVVSEKSFDYADLANSIFGAPIGRVSEAKVKDYSMMQQIDFSSAMFRDLSDPKFNDFTKVRFWKHRKLEFSSPESWSILASFDDRSPAIFRQTVERGQVTVLASGWQPEQSQLALSSKFVPMILNLVSSAFPPDQNGSQWRVGDEIAIEPGQSILDLANNRVVYEKSTDEGRYSFTTPGVYRIRQPVDKVDSGEIAANQRPAGEDSSSKATSEGTGIEGDSNSKATSEEEGVIIAVNIADSESNLRLLDIQRLAQLGVPMTEAGDDERAVVLQRQLRAVELESSQGTWRWMLCIVLGLVALESILASLSILRRRQTA